jgi:hypothetical protein
MERAIDILGQLHDASLLAVRFEPATQECVLELVGGPAYPGHFALRFMGVSALRATSAHAWGRSNAILEARIEDHGEVVFVMQSGDTVAVTSPGGAFTLAAPAGKGQR